ncbi:MAG: sel1 repeat family protein [Opitutaceae bacterium]|nr:sel1 repeat family protein [Opitutaceae bacterium]
MKTSCAATCDRRFRGGLRFGLVAACMLATCVAGVSRPEPADSRPELLSTTGGGGGETWSDIKELEAAVAKGNPRAWASLGDFKLRGEYTPQDIPGGLALLEKAARAGIATAAFSLGKAYSEGAGVTRDQTKALAYFRAAAAGKIPEAFYNLGASYASGRGVRRDYAEGLAWLILATKSGVDSHGETLLRERLTKMKRADLIGKAEKRASEISAELAEGSVETFLPGAKPAESPAPTRARPSLTPPFQSKSAPVAPVSVDRDTDSTPIRVTPPPFNPGG